ncbi:MAG: 3-oxoacyl-ACP synthase, partial [Pirellulales bacterium]|nr:3-oxoacyl-ACP synthase [Pirellulales bacterium]
MALDRDIVITGVGVVSPIGIGKAPFWTSLVEGRSGIRRLDLHHDPTLAAPIGGAVADFDPKQYVRPRKSLKVMSRDIQLAFAAADLACVDADLREKPVAPERLGVVFGAGIIPCELDELMGAYCDCIVDGKFDYNRWGLVAMADLFPLWILKYLPNMPACHIGIGQDARGPNNSITLGDVSSLSALAEATRVLERGQA